MRNCRQDTTITLPSSPVLCTGPSTRPQINIDCLIVFKVRLGEDFPTSSGHGDSTTQRERHDSDIEGGLSSDTAVLCLMCSEERSVIKIPFNAVLSDARCVCDDSI